LIGSQLPVLEIGVGLVPRVIQTGDGEWVRPIVHDGVVIRREGTKFLGWMRYRERDGTRRRESTFVEDWQRPRRNSENGSGPGDGNILEVVRKGGKSNLRGMGGFVLRDLFQVQAFDSPKTRVANQRTSEPT